MQKTIILSIAIIAFFSCKNTQTKEALIQKAVENQLQCYAQLTLKDLYKSFFQDYFGPGHLISDTTASSNYLNRELEFMQETFCPYYEPTGYNGNFYRVSLAVIKDGFISRNDYFDAFIRSNTEKPKMTLETWKTEWQQIDSVIYTMNLNLQNYNEDRKAVFQLLESDNYVGHHSETFGKTYKPHYRIIKREIFINEILPRLSKNGD